MGDTLARVVWQMATDLLHLYSSFATAICQLRFADYYLQSIPHLPPCAPQHLQGSNKIHKCTSITEEPV